MTPTGTATRHAIQRTSLRHARFPHAMMTQIEELALSTDLCANVSWSWGNIEVRRRSSAGTRASAAGPPATLATATDETLRAPLRAQSDDGAELILSAREKSTEVARRRRRKQRSPKRATCDAG